MRDGLKVVTMQPTCIICACEIFVYKVKCTIFHKERQSTYRLSTHVRRGQIVHTAGPW